MELQNRILLTYGILAAGVLVIFLTVALSTLRPPKEYEEVRPGGYAVRRVWFWTLLGVFVVAFFISISFFPYATGQSAEEGTHYPVIARQFSFQDLPATVPIDTPVVFDVTSADVNHGFAIYDPEGQIIGQVQAMPGYVNHLHMRFEEAGTYIVRCLEFCGLGHDVMRSSFEVQ